MTGPSLSRRWVFAAALLLGCQPDIGDSCSTNAQCSLTGDRLCDPTSPGGYCTQFNCLPGKCPDEAVCVGFYAKPSNACTQPVSDQRFERSFCMKKCSSNSDCRESEGYKCLVPPVAVSAVVLENTQGASVCMVDIGETKPPDRDPAICSAPPPSDGGPPTIDAAPDAASPDAASPPEAGPADGSGPDATEGATPDGGVRDARVDR